MKRMANIFLIALTCLLTCYQTGYAQSEKLTREQWLQEMQQEELKVNDYILQQLKAPVPQEVLTKLQQAEREEHITSGITPDMIEAMAKDYYRKKYFELHPGATGIYNPGRVTVPSPGAKGTAANQVITCNGNFEDGNLSSYMGYRSINTGGVCGFVPPFNVAYTPTSLTASPDDFMLTNNLPDPVIPALRQTNAGSNHAIRINSFDPCVPNRGIDMLQKLLPPPLASGRYKINFSYALVLEDFHGANTPDNPFFVARILNRSGAEVGSRICRVADRANPFYQIATAIPTGYCREFEGLIWRDWTCASIEFDAVAGDQYTIEFFMADCAQTGHFGYAYVDDICAELCCPKFMIQDCCKYSEGPRDPACCNPCSSPTNLFRVYVIDEYGRPVPVTDYTISWSHDPGNTTSSSMLMPNQQTIVTITNLDGSCVWQDTFKKVCCDDTATIIPYQLSWDPCGPNNQQRAITLKVKNKSGTIMTTAAGYTFLWEYAGGTMTSTSDSISTYPFRLPAYVTVTDPVTHCVYRDTFELKCCYPNTPANVRCNYVTGGRNLYWDPVPNAVYYKVRLAVNNTACGCSEINPPSTLLLYVYGTDTILSNTLASCYSWQVASVCPDSTTSAFSTVVCSCTTIPTCSTPTSLACQTIFVHNPSDPSHIMIQRRLSWSAVPGALSYEIEMVYDEPGCCATIGTIIIGGVIPVSTNSYDVAWGGCFSWRVRAICAGGLKSAWSTSSCSCGWGVSVKPGGNQEFTAPEPGTGFGPNDNNIKVIAAPNPASDYIDFTIQFGKADYKDLTLSVFDVSGREVSRNNVLNNTLIRVDAQAYTPGMYLYVIRENNKVLYSNRIIIKK